MELILFTYDQFLKGEAKCIQQLMQNFTFTLHLRKPDAKVEDYRMFLESIDPSLHNRIMLHDAFELVSNFTLKGLHFSSKNRSEATNYPNVFKSTSCHSIEEVKEQSRKFSYVFLSPVFPSISKMGYEGNLNMNEVITYLEENRQHKVIGLGGIDQTNVVRVSELGFHGAAVLGAVWGVNGTELNEVKNNLERIIKCMPNVHTA